MILPAVALALCAPIAGAGNGQMKGVDKNGFDETVSPKADF